MFEKILVPLDGSKLAEEILPMVESLAKIHDSKITLIRAVHAYPGVDSIEIEVRVVREAEEYLSKIEANLKEKGVKVDYVVRYGNDAQEIVDHARERHFDLLAMSTHGRTGLLQFVLGSVASKVLHYATIPVLLRRVA